MRLDCLILSLILYYVWCISDEWSMYGILIMCDDDDSNGYDDMMIVYVN